MCGGAATAVGFGLTGLPGNCLLGRVIEQITGQPYEDFVRQAILKLAGADVTMTASALLLHGPGWMTSAVSGLTDWMTEREYTSVEQLKGSMSLHGAPNPAAFARANYMETLASYDMRS